MIRKYALLSLLAVTFFYSAPLAAQEQLCVKNFQAVNSRSNRVVLRRALRIVDGDCPRGFNGLGSVKGDQGDQGVQGEQGEPGPLVTELPSAETLTGFYALGGTADAADEVFYTEIGFQFSLASTPTVEVIEQGGAATENCPGSASAPVAVPGYLCIYEGSDGRTLFSTTNRKNLRTQNFSLVQFDTYAATAYGARVSIQSVAAGNASSRGTWAVTAP